MYVCTVCMYCMCVSLTFVAGKVLDGYILDGDLFQEVGVLTPGVARDDALPPQPIAEPGQVTVTVEGIGQEVPEEKTQQRQQ